MLLTKNIFSAVLLLLTPYCANAQESLFREFLKEFKQCRQIELSCYGDIKMSKNPDVDEKLYKDFIPSDVEGSWLKGRVTIYYTKGFINFDPKDVDEFIRCARERNPHADYKKEE